MHTLTIRRNEAEDCYSVVHSDPEVRDLFGTAILPTPFRLSADPAIVLDTIRRLNPDRRVILDA